MLGHSDAESICRESPILDSAWIHIGTQLFYYFAMKLFGLLVFLNLDI